jgi:RimJ/RimL family protein N-acetyltransferase
MLGAIEARRPATAVEHLIPADAPARPRALAVIDGVLTGEIWTDDPAEPTWAVAMETADGTVYAGGALTSELLADVLSGVRTASGDFIFGFSGPRDPVRKLLPAEPYWRGEAIDFTERRPPSDEAALLRPPDGVRVVPIDAELLAHTEWYADTLHAFGSVERWLELGLGFGALVGDELVAEALAGPRCRGLLEMGIVTREAHRRRGYATLASRHLAVECEARGERVWWNASADNVASIATARRIGFSVERRYDLVALRAPLR